MGWRPLARGIPQTLPHDLQHSYGAALTAWDHAKMDGFARPSVESQSRVDLFVLYAAARLAGPLRCPIRERTASPAVR